MKKKIPSLCHQILQSTLPRRHAIIGLLLSLCSNTGAMSVTQLSLSSFFQHQYASITDAISCLSEKESTMVKVRTIFFRLAFQVLFSVSDNLQSAHRILLSVDVTPCAHPFAHTLAERTAIVMPNPVFQSFHLSKGYHLSALNVAGFDGSWNLPLSIERVRPEQTASECAHLQMANFIKAEKPGLNDRALIVQVADSGYGNSPFLLPLRKYPNLVNICRLRCGLKVYVDHRGEPGSTPSRSDKVYGQELFLIMASDTKMYKTRWHKEPTPKARTSISERPADECLQWEEMLGTRQPRAITVIVKRWNNLILRGKVGEEVMSDYPIDIVRIQQLDALTGHPVFKKEMYLVISGDRREEITAPQARQDYFFRKDTEAYFRTAKQRMLLDKFQTSDVSHIDAYLNLVQLAPWLTYALSGVAQQVCHPWERYAHSPDKEKQTRLTFSQAIRAASTYLGTLDLKPFSPQNQQGGTGRVKGQKQVPRKRHKVARKRKKST